MSEASPFHDLVPEAAAAREAGESERTWKRRRQARTGSAFIIVGRKIYYRREAIRDWLLSLEVRPAKTRWAA